MLETRDLSFVYNLLIFLFTITIFIIVAGEIIYIITNTQYFLLILPIFLFNQLLIGFFFLEFLFLNKTINHSIIIISIVIGAFIFALLLFIEVEILFFLSENAFLPIIHANILALLPWVFDVSYKAIEVFLKGLLLFNVNYILFLIILVAILGLIWNLLNKRYKKNKRLSNYHIGSIIPIVIILELLIHFIVQISSIFTSLLLIWFIITVILLLQNKNARDDQQNEKIVQMLIFWGLTTFLINNSISSILVSPLTIVFSTIASYLMNFFPLLILILYFLVYNACDAKFSRKTANNVSEKILFFILLITSSTIIIKNLLMEHWILLWVLIILGGFVLVTVLIFNETMSKKELNYVSGILIFTLLTFYLIGI
ncbi:MAG: hypothetical protein ACW981_01430 [Candidatus Hodarchaeales archaeon]